jgi:hypothetical protein
MTPVTWSCCLSTSVLMALAVALLTDFWQMLLVVAILAASAVYLAALVCKFCRWAWRDDFTDDEWCDGQ